MISCIPGTTIPVSAEHIPHPFAPIEAAMLATGGFTLAQVASLTGMQKSTIQNWIKRGWVANPKDKRYGEAQVVRILLIHMLRDCMTLAQIVSLMRYINGDVEDQSDDIIPDRQLFELLCRTIFALEREGPFQSEQLPALIGQELQDYREPIAGSKQKLTQSLSVMLLAYQAAQLKRKAQTQYQCIMQNKEMSL